MVPIGEEFFTDKRFENLVFGELVGRLSIPLQTPLLWRRTNDTGELEIKSVKKKEAKK